MATSAKYLKETFWAVAAKLTASFFYYLLIYYLTRRMALDVWGEWSGFFAILNVTLLLSDQGINVASKRYIAEARDSAGLGEVVRTSLALRLLASAIYTVAVALLARLFLRWLGQPQFLPLMRQALGLILIYGVLEYFKSLFEALHRLRFTFVVTALEHSLKFFAVFLLFRGGTQFGAILTGLTVAVLAAAVAGAVQAARAVPRVFDRSTVAGSLLRQIYVYSIPVMLTSVGGFIALEVDVIMLKNLRDNHDTGLYAAAKQIIMVLPQIAFTVSMATVPGISRFDVQTGLAQRRTYYRVMAALGAVYVFVSLGLVGFAIWGVPLFFPPEYRAASIPLLILIPFVLFNATTIYTGNLMVYRGLAWQRSANAALTLLVNIALNFWLIPIWGPAGSAAASSIAYFPYCLLNLRAADRAFRMPAPTSPNLL
jgi:O-antigen/teichoic acid export membrane protein